LSLNQKESAGNLIDSVADLPFVSVVVCTLNRKELLRECLTSLLAVDYPQSRREIIVVDGGSHDGTQEIATEFPQIRFAVEPHFGIAHARNKGAELARGAIVAYTDDDCIVGRSWLKNLVKGFQRSPQIMGVGGPVFPAFAKLPKKILVNPALGLFDEGEEPKYVGGIITSNSAFKRELFCIAHFDEDLGATRRGHLLLCGEDVEFCRTITGHKFKLFYEPNAKVYHKIRRDRVKVSYIIRHAVTNGVSIARLNQKVKKPRMWMVRYAFVGLLRSVYSVVNDQSFSVCYQIIVYSSASFISIAGIENGSLFVTKTLSAFRFGSQPATN
jgi:glycosyltransferase involved in cell wall biosynthesis